MYPRQRSASSVPQKNTKATKPRICRGFRWAMRMSWEYAKCTDGGEGGIRTPGTLTGTSDFESGALNRALPPLRIVTTCISVT